MKLEKLFKRSIVKLTQMKYKDLYQNLLYLNIIWMIFLFMCVFVKIVLYLSIYKTFILLVWTCLLFNVLLVLNKITNERYNKKTKRGIK